MLRDYRIRRALAYIDETGRDLSLAALARVAAMSPFHFHRRFRLATGATVSDYVRRKRFERAAFELLFTTRRVSDVAASSGYRSAAAFTRSFRNWIGAAPSDVRDRRPVRSMSRVQRQLQPARTVYEPSRALSFIERRGTIVEATGKAWDAFAAAGMGESSEDVVGLCPDYPGVTATGEMRYQVGAPHAGGQVPKSVTRRLPGGWYAVFVHRGHFNDMKHINELWGEIYGAWPEDGAWELRSSGAYESYPVVRGQLSHQIGEVRLYVPVRPRVIEPA